MSESQAVDNVPFSILADLFSALRNARPGSKRQRALQTQQKDSRYAILTRFWLQLCRQVKSAESLLTSRETDGQIIPAQLLPPEESFKLISFLVPELDTVHNYYNMKEAKLADSFIRALDLPPTSEDAQWLKNYKERAYRPSKWRQNASIVDGNLPTVLKAVLADRCPSSSSLTIGLVWKILDTLGQSAQVRSGRIIKASYADDKSTALRTDAGFELAQKRSAAQNNEKKYGALTTLVQNGTANEVAEVTRIILRDLNMHLSRDNFLNWFHPAAKQHYTQIHDVHKMISDCYDPNFDIGDAAVQIRQYASVMLTMRPSRKNLPTICEKLLGGVTKSKTEDEEMDTTDTHDIRPFFIMEPKLDGERLQLHKWKGKNEVNGVDIGLRTFTRRGNDSSPMYADALFEVIKNSVRAQDIILDGEIMIWDDLRETWLRFEDMREITTAIARQAVPEGASYTLKYMVFDVLYVDQGTKRLGEAKKGGNMVMRLPLYKRRKLLDKIVHKTEISYGAGVKAVVELVGMERGHDEQELTNALQRYETLGYEGVIAKHPDRPYVLAERSLDIAIKLKPDYFDGGIQDVDVLILGAKFSTSRGHRKQRAGKLSSFLVGVRASETDQPQWRRPDDDWDDRLEACKWIVVGSVGTGYSDKDLEQMQAHLQMEWRDFDAKNLPDHFEKRNYASTVLSGVAKWVQPRKSIVLTVRAYELNRRFNILRFPRVQRVNWEKPYYDVTTYSHLVDLDENKLPAFVRADEGDIDDVSDKAPNTKRRKRGELESDEEAALQIAKEEGHEIRGGRSGRKVIASATGADVSETERISTAFEGLKFHVTMTDQKAKEDTEVKIHQLGGRFVQTMTGDVDMIICTAGDVAKVKRMKERAIEEGFEKVKYSIVLSTWVSECHSKRKKVKPMGNEIVFAGTALQAEVYKDCDKFGDWWTKDADIKSFEWSIAEVEKRESLAPYVTQDIEAEIERCLKKSGMIFKQMVVFVHNGKCRLVGSVGLLKAFGARIAKKLDKNVTHVLVHSDEERGDFGHALAVTEDWVRKCVDGKQLVDAT